MSKQLLIYGNRKQDDVIWDISSSEKESAAFLELFIILDNDWDVYADLINPGAYGPKNQQELYKRAKNGESMAAKKLLTMRKNAEYENWHYGEAH